MADAELWRRAVDGDADAFGRLFDRHAHSIFAFCVRRTGDRAGSEDLVSATFLHAWRRRADMRPIADGPLPWFYGIASNLARRHLRGLGRRRAAMTRLVRANAEPDREPDPFEDVADRMDAVDRVDRAMEALEAFPERDRDLFVLCVWQGLTYEEAAAALGIPVGTVRSRLSRARGRLRAELEELTRQTGDERVAHHHAKDGKADPR